MYDVQYQAFGVPVAVDNRAVSERAAKAAELLRAARERKLARRLLRKQRHLAGPDRQAYTTAV